MATTIQVGGVRRRPSALAQGGGLTEEQRQDLLEAKYDANRAIEQISEVWVTQDTNSLSSAFESTNSKIFYNRDLIFKLDEDVRTLKKQGGAGSGISEEALDEIREGMTDAKTYIQNLKVRGTLDFISQFSQVTDNPDEDAERIATYAYSLKGMVDALNQFPPIEDVDPEENVDPEALTPGGQLLKLKNDIEQLKGLLGATREGVLTLFGNIRDLKYKADNLERMVSNPRVYTDELHFDNEDDVKDLSQGERDLIIATLKRAMLSPWLADEEVWGKWWVYDMASSIKKLTPTTREFNAGRPWYNVGYISGYRFQTVNGATLVGNFYTLEQAIAAMNYPTGDLHIYAYYSSTPHAIFDPIPEYAQKVANGHIALDLGTGTLSTVEGDYELIKDTPDFRL